ncbi:MAG: hypothetical protein ABJE47_01410 [bacterium]
MRRDIHCRRAAQFDTLEEFGNYSMTGIGYVLMNHRRPVIFMTIT